MRWVSALLRCKITNLGKPYLNGGLYRRLNACTNSRQILFFYPHIRFKRTTSKFRSLTLATAAKIADHFGVRIDDLVEHS